MKKILALLALMFISAAFFIACEKNVTETSNNENATVNNATKFANPYNTVGIKHNQGLDYVFNELSNTDLNGLSKQEVIDIVKKSCESYDKSICLSITDITTANAIVDAMITNDMFTDNNNFTSLVNNAKNITSEQAKYLSKVAFLMGNKMTNEEMTTAVEKIENEVNTVIINREEKNKILIVTAVAKNSYCYWNTNADKWVKMFDSKTKGASISGSDACGAAVGVGVGTVIVPGAGSVGGAIGGAFGASSVAAVIRFWNWL